MVLGVALGTFVSFLLGLFRPAAGPDWMWAGGRRDIIRGLYFRRDGTFRRFGRIALFVTLAGGSAAVYWMLLRV
ncbi:MAG TPA: hypothetical protein VFC18_15230 [Burkholderiales bacterium]|nr:hypothetical protein [Burkholderiales bacterium]